MADNSLITVDQLRDMAEYVRDAIAAAIDDIVLTVNLDTGNLEYESSMMTLNIDEETGNLVYNFTKDEV